MICDAHVHFFSPGFFSGLARQMPAGKSLTAGDVLARLGWDDPLSADVLADRWATELDTQHVARAALMASLPNDAPSVAAAVARHPSRFVGFFMVDPTRNDAADYVTRSLDAGLQTVSLFPSMHGYSLHDDRITGIFELLSSYEAAKRPSPTRRDSAKPKEPAKPATPAVFVHCGVLSVGVRKTLGLASPFEIRFGNPLDLHGIALKFPAVPIIVPHFGAGMLREALMLADVCPNVYLDTSSSNSWIRYTPGLTLEHVFETALATVGPDRLLFGTDSSFFPRGWNREIYTRQRSALDAVGASRDAQAHIVGGNFNRLFPVA